MLLQSDKDLIEQIRIIAAKRLQGLYHEINTIVPQQVVSQTIPSWVHQHRSTDDNNVYEDNGTTYRSSQCLFFDYTGFIHVPGFVSHDIYSEMKDEIHRIVETQWDPDKTLGDTFGTNEEQNISRGNYFLSSANQVHFFTEPKAMEDVVTIQQHNDENDDIEVKTSTDGLAATTTASPQQQRLKSEFCTPHTKIYALNKIGHGLHLIPNSAFQRYTTSDPVRHLLTDLGWRDPVVPQSMYIFKQPNQIGGIVNSHQDSTFLYTNPYPTCIGLWLALDDATIENGCLWVRPCSHNYISDDANSNENSRVEHLNSLQKLNVRRQYRRNELHFGNDTIHDRSNIPVGDTIHQPMFEMAQIFHDPMVPWDGSLPDGTNEDATTMNTYESLLQAGFIPIECKAGDVLAFTGTLDHLSLGNNYHSHRPGRSSLENDRGRSSISQSSSSRHTFQLHIVEGPSQGIEWSPYNWLQYPKNEAFLRLNSQ